MMLQTRRVYGKPGKCLMPSFRLCHDETQTGVTDRRLARWTLTKLRMGLVEVFAVSLRAQAFDYSIWGFRGA
jgi:hypothetical protein